MRQADYRKSERFKALKRGQNLRHNFRHPDSIAWAKLKDRSLKNGKPFDVTKEDFHKWWEAQPSECTYCGVYDLSLDSKLMNGKNPRKLTIDRKNPKLGYSLDNICFACWTCNFHKSDFFNYDEWKEIAEKYVRPRWERRLAVAIS